MSETTEPFAKIFFGIVLGWSCTKLVWLSFMEDSNVFFWLICGLSGIGFWEFKSSESIITCGLDIGNKKSELSFKLMLIYTKNNHFNRIFNMIGQFMKLSWKLSLNIFLSMPLLVDQGSLSVFIHQPSCQSCLTWILPHISLQEILLPI